MNKFSALFVIFAWFFTHRAYAELPVSPQYISFFDLWKNPKNYHGKFIVLDGVIDSSVSEFPEENIGYSDSGYGSLFPDVFNYEIVNHASSLTLYFQCNSKVDIMSLNGKPVHLSGVYWHVDHSIVNNSMGVIQVVSYKYAEKRGNENKDNRIVKCNKFENLKGVPNTRNKE